MAGSNGTRMAGEELSKADSRARARERIGNDPDRLAERLSGIDREAYDFDGYTDKEINMAMQGGTFDENDYARLTGNPVEDTPDPTPDPEEEEVTTPETPEDPPVGSDPVDLVEPYMPPPVQKIQPYNPGGQNINQDNDQTSTVTGNNNNVNQNQDNSINGYGGNSSWKDAWMKDYFE